MTRSKQGGPYIYLYFFLPGQETGQTQWSPAAQSIPSSKDWPVLPLAAEEYTVNKGQKQTALLSFFPSGGKPEPLGPLYPSLNISRHPHSLGLLMEFAPYQLAEKECREDTAACSKQKEA